MSASEIDGFQSQAEQTGFARFTVREVEPRWALVIELGQRAPGELLRTM
ncbi:MAG: hypothetical protein H0U54_14845 [Acidobacteria bacterium]|jgi:hypothetical protein|nr:hypothetical protein [Acidobacteriota bacterium]